jgi:hypothetical protein
MRAKTLTNSNANVNYNFVIMTVEQFFRDTQFGVCEGFMFERDFAVAYMRPKPTLFVSAALIQYIKKEAETDGEIEFIRNIELNVSDEWNPVFKPD